MTNLEASVANIQEAAERKVSTIEVTSEERHQLIAQAAYYRAEQRNFAPGCELEDWLQAEAEIEIKLSSMSPTNLIRNS